MNPYKDMTLAARRARESRWKAKTCSRVVHPRFGEVIVPHTSNYAAMPATLGYTAHHALLTGGQPGAFAVSPEFTGTLPVPATVGYSVCGALRSGGVAAGYTASPEFAGTLPEEAQHGN